MGTVPVQIWSSISLITTKSLAHVKQHLTCSHYMMWGLLCFTARQRAPAGSTWHLDSVPQTGSASSPVSCQRLRGWRLPYQKLRRCIFHEICHLENSDLKQPFLLLLLSACWVFYQQLCISPCFFAIATSRGLEHSTCQLFWRANAAVLTAWNKCFSWAFSCVGFAFFLQFFFWTSSQKSIGICCFRVRMALFSLMSSASCTPLLNCDAAG